MDADFEYYDEEDEYDDDGEEEDEYYDVCIDCGALAQPPDYCLICTAPLCRMCYDGGGGICAREHSSEELSAYLGGNE